MEKEFFEKTRKQIKEDRVSTPLKYVEFGVDFYKSFINSNYQIVTFIGVIAGFGFTALSNVQSRILFFLGELILIGLAYYLLFSTTQISKSEAINLFEQKNKWISFYNKQIELLDKAEKEKYSGEKYNKELNELFLIFFPESQSNLNNNAEIEKMARNQNIYSLYLMIGFSLLFLSFFATDILFIIRCYFFI